jgi:flagellar assembly factor FliW
MIIHSQALGEIDIDPAQVIHFPEGIPAFEEEKNFVVIPLEEGPFYYLQAVNSQLCLLTAEPFVFFPGYEVDLPSEQLAKLEANEDEKALTVFTIITVPEDFRQATANLLAPIIINTSRKKGFQFIPAKSDYKTKHLLFAAEAKACASAQGER